MTKGNAYLRDYGSKGKLQDTDGISDTLLSAMGTGGGNVPLVKEEVMLMNNGETNLRIRKLTPLER